MTWTLIFIAVCWIGVWTDQWSPVAALFAAVLYGGFNAISEAIKTRSVTVNFAQPIRLRYLHEEDDHV